MWAISRLSFLDWWKLRGNNTDQYGGFQSIGYPQFIIHLSKLSHYKPSSYKGESQKNVETTMNSVPFDGNIHLGRINGLVEEAWRGFSHQCQGFPVHVPSSFLQPVLGKHDLWNSCKFIYKYRSCIFHCYTHLLDNYDWMVTPMTIWDFDTLWCDRHW